MCCTPIRADDPGTWFPHCRTRWRQGEACYRSATVVHGKPEGSLHRLHRLGTGIPQLHGADYVVVYTMLVLTCSSLGETGPGGVVGWDEDCMQFPIGCVSVSVCAAAW